MASGSMPTAWNMKGYQPMSGDPAHIGEYMIFDQDRIGTRVAIRVSDILPFLGSTLGRNVRIDGGRIATIVGVMCGGKPPSFNAVESKVTVLVHPTQRFGDVLFNQKDISWAEVFVNNPDLYRTRPMVDPKEKAASPSERSIDLRGLIRG